MKKETKEIDLAKLLRKIEIQNPFREKSEHAKEDET